MEGLYTLERCQFSCPFFGISMQLPIEWIVKGAFVPGRCAVFEFGHPNDEKNFSLEIWPENDLYVAAYFRDEQTRKRAYPTLSRWPFGNAFVQRQTAGSPATIMLFRHGSIICKASFDHTILPIERSVTAILTSLRFSKPFTEGIPAKLKVFQYLHPSAPIIRKTPKVRPALAKTELTNRIDRYKQNIARPLSYWEQIPERNYALVYSGSGQYHLGIAICQHLLGNQAEARQSFADSAAAYRKAWSYHPSDEPPVIRYHGIVAAILSGDQALAEGCAAAVKVVEGKFVMDLFTQALADIVMKSDAAEASISRLLAAPDERAIRQKFYPGLGKAVQALLANDQPSLEEAINIVLRRHHRMVPNNWRNNEQGAICLPATVLSMLALQRGMVVAADTDLRQCQITLTAMYSPDRGKETDIVTDLMPAGLVG